jgi:hypothetical protein
MQPPQASDLAGLIAKRAHELAARLRALPEVGMREAVLSEHLSVLRDEDAAALAGEIARRAPSGKPYDVALLALAAVLDDAHPAALGYERRSAIYAIARTSGDHLLARLLLSSQAPPVGTPERVAIPGRPELTLGERKTLARTRRRELIDRMLRDTDPTVLQILLQNPRVTELDAIRLAARRPTTPEAQRVVFRTARFAARYGVRRALVLNPFTPTDLAAQLVTLLQEPDLRVVERDVQLADTVRAAARAQLAIVVRGASTPRRPGED